MSEDALDSDGSPIPADPPAVPSDDDALLAECRVETFRAGGKGGQHQNKTESAVRITHVPTGVSATSRKERSQYRNKGLALASLRRKLEALSERPVPRVRTRVPRQEKEKRLQQKRRRKERKELRRPPPDE
jgi:protein subunit release factor B